MTTLYLDTSALAKAYVREIGSNRVREATRSAEVLATSVLAIAEFGSLIGRRVRMGDLADGTAEAALADFRSDLRAYYLVNLSLQLAEAALDIAREFALRGSDAVHVATAQELCARTDPALPALFVAADRRLLAAAERLGIPVMDASIEGDA